ncbi:hypothetical protein [Angustibacter aerolatus]
MGFEVLDVGGRPPSAGVQPDEPVEPFSFDELPTARDLDPPAPAPEWRRRPAALIARHRKPLLLGAVVAALVVGLVAGLALGGARERSAQREAARAKATVVAEVTTMNDYAFRGRRVVGLSVRLINYGDQPVSVVGSLFGDRPRPGRPRVDVAGGNTSRIAPNGSILVAVTGLLDCSSQQPRWPSVPVRTADGTVHQVELATTGLGALAAVTLCSREPSSTRSPLPTPTSYVTRR